MARLCPEAGAAVTFVALAAFVALNTYVRWHFGAFGQSLLWTVVSLAAFASAAITHEAFWAWANLAMAIVWANELRTDAREEVRR